MLAHLGSLLGALLPEPERSGVVRRLGGDPPRVSALIGLVEFIGGVGLLYDNAMFHFRRMTDQIATEFVAFTESHVPTTEQAMAFTGSGSMVWLFWLMRPLTWVLISIPAVGLMRVISYLTVREAFGEPALWALSRLARALRAGGRRIGERIAFGAAGAADQVETVGSTGFLVHTVRPRPDWTDGVTIEIAGRHYRVRERTTVLRPGGRRHRFHLVEAGANDLVRRLVVYQPPPLPDRSARPGR